MSGAVEGFVLIRGPGRVRIVSGSAEVLGGPLNEGEVLVVPAGRSVIARIDGKALVSGRFHSIDARDYEAIDSLAGDAVRKSRIVLVGPSDSGKSTLASWIANKSRGSLDIISADVGQNEVYAPGFMARASVRVPVVPGSDESYVDVEPCFVGSFQPRGLESRYVACASRLARSSANGFVMDTDGWVEMWGGVDSKAALAIASGARLVIGVGLGSRESRYLEGVWGIDVARVDRIAGGSVKSVEERSLHRERLIALRVVGGRERRVKHGDAEIVGIPVFTGDPIRLEEARRLVPGAVYGEVGPGGVTIVARRLVRIPRVRVLQEGWERGLIAAVHAEKGVYVGVVTRASYRERSVSVLTRAEGRIHLVEVGRSRVDIEALTGRPKL